MQHYFQVSFNFVDGPNNSKYRDGAPLKKHHSCTTEFAANFPFLARLAAPQNRSIKGTLKLLKMREHTLYERDQVNAVMVL